MLRFFTGICLYAFVIWCFVSFFCWDFFRHLQSTHNYSPFSYCLILLLYHHLLCFLLPVICLLAFLHRALYTYCMPSDVYFCLLRPKEKNVWFFRNEKWKNKIQHQMQSFCCNHFFKKQNMFFFGPI